MYKSVSDEYYNVVLIFVTFVILVYIGRMYPHRELTKLSTLYCMSSYNSQEETFVHNVLCLQSH